MENDIGLKVHKAFDFIASVWIHKKKVDRGFVVNNVFTSCFVPKVIDQITTLSGVLGEEMALAFHGQF